MKEISRTSAGPNWELCLRNWWNTKSWITKYLFPWQWSSQNVTTTTPQR